MHTAVILPYRPHADHGIIRWTLEGYAQQALAAGDSLEVYVGIDGAAPGMEVLVPPPSPYLIEVQTFPYMGAAAVRNALVRALPGTTDLLIFGNADARPAHDFVQRHSCAIAGLPPQSLVLGAAPWERHSSTVIDVLIDTTPMIFSYCHATAHCWYPFRIAYSLNLSVRYRDFVASGGFPDLIRPYYYEDLAFGCRVLGPTRQGLYYEPAARVLHRHPMTFEQYLDREELLGIMAPVLAQVCPEAFAVLMAGRAVEEIARDFEQKLQGDPKVYRSLFTRVREKLAQPAETLGQGPERTRGIETLYQLHIPVKLLAFRLGFLRGMELRDDSRWQERKPAGLWRQHVAS
jgi:hypothetical protein